MSSVSQLNANAVRLDHVAIAVSDLEAAIEFYRDVLGLELVQRRSISGKKSGMVSAEMSAGPFNIVLVQGTDPESQVTRFVEQFGPGVQHVAIEVDNLACVADDLRERGLEFETNIITGPGLTQIFSRRDAVSGVMFEFIERTGTAGFHEDNVRSLFEQLELSNAV